MIIGMFSVGLAVRKCWSMSLQPDRNFSTIPNPYCKHNGTTPTALHTEKRPPTQSQKPKTFESSMPKAFVFSNAVEQAAICLPTASGVPSSLMSHSFTVLALSIVSAVVKVFEITSTNVVSAFNPSKARFTSMGSTFAKKRNLLPSEALAPSGSVFKASWTNSTPKYEPPMPMARTSVNALPVWPFQSPDRTLSVKALMASNTFQTSSTTFLPSTVMLVSRAALSATCKTDLPSVWLIFSPANIFFFFSSTPALSASLNNMPMVSMVTFSRQ
mmetsp:Transcript_22254/g.50824  ORF Transcript_22254/g.50824 Transcript_22254/m.50824 type:complete len:272 (+) Transcript_22254:747-1562(+)